MCDWNSSNHTSIYATTNSGRMEGGALWRSSSRRYENLERDNKIKVMTSLPSLRQPHTPYEPMEFLSRSWSVSAADISSAFAQKPKQFMLEKKNSSLKPESFIPTQVPPRIMNASKRLGSSGRWFGHRDLLKNMKNKDKARAENARTHAAICVARLAAALAALTATEDTNKGGSKMSTALASATELIAAHCIEVAESTGADHGHLVSVMQSALEIQSPSDLMTLTAAAATALRGEAALKARFLKDAKKNATVIPYEKGMGENHTHTEWQDSSIGDSLQQVYKGELQWKHVTVYINKKSQVIIKLKTKHVGGAFTTKNKGVIYGVCDDKASWPFRKVRENAEYHFGVKTAKGLLEFKCKTKIQKQKWVDTIQHLLQRTSNVGDMERSLNFLSI